LPAGRPCRAAEAIRHPGRQTAWQITALSAASRYWYIAIPLFAVVMVLYLGAGCAAQSFRIPTLTEGEPSSASRRRLMPDRQRRQRRGVGAQDAWAQRYRHDEGQRTQRLTFRRIEAPSGR